MVVVRTTKRGRAVGRELFRTLNSQYARVLGEAAAMLPEHRQLLGELIAATERFMRTLMLGASIAEDRLVGDDW